MCSSYIANPTSASIYFNTNLVNPKDFKSYWDLVSPKWKGKYRLTRAASTGIGPSLQFFYYHPELGPEFLRKLFVDQQPVFTPGPAPNHGLARSRKVCPLHGLPRF